MGWFKLYLTASSYHYRTVTQTGKKRRFCSLNVKPRNDFLLQSVRSSCLVITDSIRLRIQPPLTAHRRVRPLVVGGGRWTVGGRR